jgi:dTDP-glucose 4,6-dehydratase
VLRIAQDVIAATGSDSTIEFVDRPVDDPGVRRPDTTLAEQALDWRPRIEWRAGLTSTVAWFREAVPVPQSVLR